MKLPMTGGEWWTASAMAQDALVADLLLRIRHSTKHQATRPNSSAGKLAADLAPAGWGVRQPRSAATVIGSRTVTSVATARESCRNRKEKIRRASPSTPLSWSGGSGGGGSGGVDGCEASSSRSLNRSPNPRSKQTSRAASEVNAVVSTSKGRKKKTYAELREEEGLLLQERIFLNQELAVLGATVREQRAENENLKRIKLDLSTPSIMNPSSSATPPPGHAQNKKVMTKASTCGLSSASASHQPNPSPISCNAESEMSSPAQTRADFVLPDLNMIPISELDSTS